MIFEPSLSFYKSKYGATAAGSSLRLRVVMPRNYCVNYCFLVISEDGRATLKYPMTWECTDGNTENWYTDFTPSRPGLLFYHFEFITPMGTGSVMRTAASQEGSFSGSLKWQLTVYDPAFRTPDFIKGGIIYQIFPDRFLNSGTTKNGVPSDRILRGDFDGVPEWKPDKNGKILNNDYFGGDFAGIASKADYLASLGVNCVYLNPVSEAHSNHRYNTADYMRPDPLLGAAEDFSEMCRALHERDIKVIIDGVFSHTGDDSVYFNKNGRYGSGGAYNGKNSPYRKWYKFGAENSYLSWWNIDTLPEVKEEEPSYISFITGENGVIDYWLSLGADGYRLDVADELPDVFIDAVRKAVKRNSDENYLLGEVWEDASNKISHGGRRRFLLGEQLDGVMNYPFRKAIIDFLLTSDAESFMSAVTSVVQNYPPEAMHACMNHLGTHDTERILTALAGIKCDKMTREQQSRIKLTDEQYADAIKLFKAAVLINYTLPGVPCIYYGDEAGMTGGKDPFNRACYPWGRENAEILDFMKWAGTFRRNAGVLKDGGFYPISAALGCVAYLRYKEGLPRVLTVANNNESEIDYRLHADMLDMRCVTGGTRNEGGVMIPAKTCAILID